jgi:hypothetical protein
MTTVQIVGIVVAAAIVLLLIIALLVTRRRASAGEESPVVPAHASFLDDAPQDTLATLGRAEQPMEDITIDPGAHRQERPAGQATAPAPLMEPASSGLGLDWGPSSDTFAADETTMPTAPTPLHDPITESGASADEPVPARPAEGGSAAAQEAAPESGAGARMVPLSDIIVTTSHKMVDLKDPEVRRMLTDLVKDEIDQATHYRQQGQTIDAVLQLTEAEKISRALDMHESAAAIRTMMADLQGQV